MFEQFRGCILVLVVFSDVVNRVSLVGAQPASVPLPLNPLAAAAIAGQHHSGGSTQRNTVCVLPLGDSLTQGVGQYGSYRAALEGALQQPIRDTAHPSGQSAVRVQFVGSHQRVCTPKRPNTPFPSDAFVEPHEGHCSWNSRMLLQHLQQLWGSREAGTTKTRNHNNDKSNLDAPAQTSSDRYLRRSCAKGTLDAVLLMIGHNDAFQAARHCRLREGDTSLRPAAAAEEQRAMTAAAHCVSQFLKEYEANLAAMVHLLLTTFPTAVVFLGLNPTTRFAVADVVLHQIISGVQQQLQFADLPGDDGNTVPPHTVVRRGSAAVVTVLFEGWTSGKHTFDSTHPNALGNRLLAEAWAHAIRQHLSHLFVDESAGRTVDLAALAEAREEAEAIRRLEAAPVDRMESLLGRNRKANWLPKHDGDDDDPSDAEEAAKTLRWLALAAFGVPLTALLVVRRLRNSVVRLGVSIWKLLCSARSRG